MQSEKKSGRNRGYLASNGKGKKRNKNDKPESSTFKYSARFTAPLHEAIVLGSEPLFVTYSSASGHFELVRKIEETNRVLVPPYPEEYPYDPIIFDSLEELSNYEEMARHETIDSLYRKTKAIVILYVDQDAEVINLITADIIWTYFQDLYPTTHYYDITGKENGIGKSTIGYVFEGLAYRGVRMTDPSAANLFRLLSKVEPGQCIIIADEADRIHQDREMLAIYKEGYAIGGKVAKINTNTMRQEFFYPYCFKIRIAEESLRGNITKGVIDCSFLIKASRGRPTHDIKEVLHPANRNERLAKLHEEIKSHRKLLLAYRLFHFSDDQRDITTKLEGRNKELCKPLLHLFHGSKAYSEVERTLQTFLDRKNKQKKNISIEPVVYGIVVNLVSRLGKVVSTSQMWNSIKANIEGYADDKRPNEYQTQDYDTIYRNTISKTICDNFGAEREHRRDGNVFVFDVAKLVRAGKVYDIETNFQTSLDREREASEPREGREGQSNPSGQNTHRKLTEPENKNDNISNGIDIEQQISEEMKEGKGPMPGIEPSQPPQSSQIGSTKVYKKRGTDLYGCKDCKLKGDKYFMQVHNCKCLRDSKVADAASTNLSGNGVLGNNPKQVVGV